MDAVTKLSDQELQSKVLELAEAGTRLYLKGSGGLRPPEHFLQNYCTAELIKAGFVVNAETNVTKLREWHLQEQTTIDPDLKGARIDLLIYDPPDDGNAEHAPLRAVVEFKVSPWHIDDDVRRTARLVAKLKAHPKHAHNANAFGYIVAGGEMFKEAGAAQIEIEAIEPFVQEGHGPVASRVFYDPLPGYGQQHGVVIGLPITATIASQTA